MALRFQAPAGVHRGRSFVQTTLSVASKHAAPTSSRQSEVLGGQHFCDGEAVVDFSQVNLASVNARHGVGFGGGFPGGFELRDGGSVMKCQMVRGSARTSNPNRCIGEFLGHMIGSENHARRTIRGWAAVVER